MFTLGFFIGVSAILATLFFLKYWLDFKTLDEQRKIIEDRMDLGEKQLMEFTRIRLHLSDISDCVGRIDGSINKFTPNPTPIKKK